MIEKDVYRDMRVIETTERKFFVNAIKISCLFQDCEHEHDDEVKLIPIKCEVQLSTRDKIYKIDEIRLFSCQTHFNAHNRDYLYNRFDTLSLFIGNSPLPLLK